MTMTKHSWIIDVCQDLREYAKAHDLGSTYAAITHDLNIAYWEIEEEIASSVQNYKVSYPPYSYSQLNEADWYNVVILPRNKA